MSWIDKDGYVVLKRKPRVLEHIAIAEMALGKSLPKNAVVHHVDGNKQNNINSNLVICPDKKYHNLIHARMRALAICGNPNWSKCIRCFEYDSPHNLSKSKNQSYHKECNNLHAKKMLHIKKMKEKQNEIRNLSVI